MPKTWITWDKRYSEWVLWDKCPEKEQDIVECDMNASLFRQIKAAEKKYDKFQDLLEKFYAEGVEHPKQVRRVR